MSFRTAGPPDPSSPWKIIKCCSLACMQECATGIQCISCSYIFCVSVFGETLSGVIPANQAAGRSHEIAFREIWRFSAADILTFSNLLNKI